MRQLPSAAGVVKVRVGGRRVTALAQVEQFIDQSRRASTPRQLESLLSDMTSDMGFQHYALIHHVDLTPMRRDLRHMDNGSLVAITNYPEAWVETYVARNMVAQDPVHLASHRTNVGFRWDDVGNFIRLTLDHRAMFDDTRRAGIEEGYTVPANVPGEANGSCTFAVRRGARLPEENLAMAQLVGSFAFQAARSMVMRAQMQPRLPEPPPLTQRQLDCVLLVGRGKSDWEIGRILGISEETVKHHLKLAREHYDVAKRVQVVMRAVYDGQLTLNDLIN